MRRTRTSTTRSVDEHRCAIADLGLAARVRAVPIGSAVGAVLAEDVVAERALPPFGNSAVDGFAVRHTDVAGSQRLPTTLTVSARSVAGRASAELSVAPGECVQIMTGAVLPRGADLVVPVEHTSGFVTSFGFDTVTICSNGSKSNIRGRASDFDAGDVAIRAGTVLTLAQVGLLAALGRTHVRIGSTVTVAVLSTGSEICCSGSTPMLGECFDANSPMIAADLLRCGADVHLESAVSDDVQACREALARCAAVADVIVTTGGISAGTEEVVRLALADHDVDFASVAVRPGKPQGCGRFDGVPIICLPGNPVSALISYELFVRPVLASALQDPAAERTVRTVRVRGDGTSPSTTPRVLLGFIDGADASVTQSHSMRALAAANGLVVVPPGDSLPHATGQYPAWTFDSRVASRPGRYV
ncbi:molybdopterin molybdotransferase MoeA [Rhodococcus sp. IEGM 1354]|uniref:molybdopterin molybdotransferase MoeA n=1 Tax=Rhodococcus sp. IEGM 1354 TaxID=3047088 RepID=UPI0024B71420|nr:gephyrin-like molybdotransferase Glp [Rhodococcus sp. IEGM 1354]MDI9932211.1 molybdopterin molybdotransferase MoeA [Rhodococcus sp. IEGM 1354]